MDRYATLADEELLVHARDDVEAFAEFYDRRAQGVLRFFLWRGVATEDAVDLTAEVFAAVLTSVHRYRPEEGTRDGVALRNSAQQAGQVPSQRKSRTRGAQQAWPHPSVVL